MPGPANSRIWDFWNYAHVKPLDKVFTITITIYANFIYI
jgi:hypothetical protein